MQKDALVSGSNKKQRGIPYTWVIIAICFLMIFANYGFCSSNRGLYLTAITEALGMKRSIFSISDTCRHASTAFISIFFGRLIKRFGAKKLIGAGYLCLIGFAVCYALGNSIWIFCLGSSMLGIGIAWTTTTMVGSILNKWCTKNKGVIMGVVLSANGVGGAIAAQIIAPIIYQEGNSFGYRNAYWLVAAILAAVGLLAVVLYKENPEPKDIISGTGKKKGRGAEWIGIDIKEAKRKPYFYGSMIALFFTGMVLQATSEVAAAYFQDIGMEAGYVATLLSVTSLALTGSKFLAGLMYDKLGLRITVTVCDIAAVLASVILWCTTSVDIGMILGMVYAIVTAISLPLHTILIPILASELFGDKSCDQISGLFVAACTTGLAIGGPLINSVFDRIGTYRPAFLVCAVLMLMVTVILQFVMKATGKERL